MTYVEWLRIRNTLRTLAIILGILVGLAVVLRISVARYMSPVAWVQHMSLDPGTKKSTTVLPDGTKRMVLENPGDRTRIVIDDHGNAGTHVVITEPTSRAHKHDSDVNVGSIHVYETEHGAMTTTVVDTNGAVPMLYYMGIADFFALIVATVLAAPLAREITGHLETTLTKPISRLKYGLAAIGVDVVGILAASLMTVVAFYVCQLLFETPRLDFSGVNSRAIVMGIACPLAWYAMLCAATTWLPRSYGAVLGLFPLGLLFAGALTLVPTGNIVALFIHDVAWVISRFDPLTYVSLAEPSGLSTISYSGSNFPQRLSLEILFFVGYGALALLRWQRVEA